MTTKQTIYKFSKSQCLPTAVFHAPQTQELPNDTLLNELIEIKQVQYQMGLELKILTDACVRIGESVNEVSLKLSQYDIDGDDSSTTCDSTDAVKYPTDDCIQDTKMSTTPDTVGVTYSDNESDNE
jgi:hypothetical protein